MKKLLFIFAVGALAIVASAKSYNVKLFQSATVGGKELSPGDYKVEVVDQKAVIRNGKIDAEAPVKVETADKKYDTTSVRLATGSGTPRIAEIRVGGTKTRLVFISE